MLTSYRALLPGIALLCSLVALILALCCLLAGTNPDTLPHMELYTLNASKFASTLLLDMHLPQVDPSFTFGTLIPRNDLDSALSNAGNSITNQGNNFASEAGNFVKDPTAAIEGLQKNITRSVEQGKQELSDAVSKAEGAVKNATNEIVSAFINETVQSLHIHDFYIAHLLTYCEGQYTGKGNENLTYCSNHKPNKKNNSTTATGNGTITGVVDDPLAFIENLHLPDPVEYALEALTLLAKVISAFYIVGIISLFISLLSAALIIPTYFAPPNAIVGGGAKRKLLRWATLASSGCAFFTLFLASGMVHFLVKKLCGLFNKHPGAGVAAYPGNRLQECSWAGVILVGIAMTLAVVDVAVGLAASSARLRVEEAAGRKWWGRSNREEEKYDL